MSPDSSPARERAAQEDSRPLRHDGSAGPGDDSPPPGFERVAAVSELPPGTLKACRVGDLALAICNVDGEIFAVEDNCSHQHFPLSQSELDDDVLTCGWHGAQFDVRTGRALSLPAVKPVRTFALEVRGGEVYVRTEGEAPTPPEALIQRERLEGGLP